MAKKKKPASKTLKPKKTQAKKSTSKNRPARRKKASSKARKPNRYNTLRKAISQYCYRKYNHRCTNEEINRIYKELKRRYFDVDPKKQLSPSELAKNIDSILGFKDKDDLPLDLRTFNWFDVDTFLREQDGLFFKKGDKITLDLGSFGGEITFDIQDIASTYRNDVYPMIRQGIDQYEQQFGQRPSPPPYFDYDEAESDSKKRKFVWRLEVDAGVAAISQPSGPTGSEPPQPESPSAPSSPEGQETEKILQLRKEAAEAETKRNQSRLELIREGRELLKEGLIDKEQFTTMFLDS
jgi:hypothetical protein